MRLQRQDALPLLILAALPVLAHAPAWWEGRLLGPGDGAAMHLPLRALTWEAFRAGTLPGWNPTIFMGTPLLAAYRPGAFHPLMALLTPLRPFLAFQLLVLSSLSLAAVLTYLYVRRLGAGRMGGYVAGLCFALGPYLVGHLGDTATVVAAPLVVLLLMAAESHARGDSPGRAAGLAVALALLLVAGSPEAARAGAALLAGRLIVAHTVARRRDGPTLTRSLLATAAGVALAAPQLVPTLILAADAGRQVTGLAPGGAPLVPGATGLLLRYASHTPAPALALAALPLALTETPVRVLGSALVIALLLQYGRGPLAAPGALALVFDLTLAVLAGLSISAQWDARREPLGRRLRAYLLFACLASAAALAVAAAALGPLPQTLAGAVGVLGLALILYFPLATSLDPVKAGVWLLPLSVSFVLQPHGRQAWDGAPTEEQLRTGSATRAALDGAMGPRRGERIFSLVFDWPAEAADLGFAGLGTFAGLHSANGYDPMAPMRNRLALAGMGPSGTVPPLFLRSEPARLEAFSVRWVQVPTDLLARRSRLAEFEGPAIDSVLSVDAPRFYALPITPATEIVLVSHLSDSVPVDQDAVVANVEVRLATGRSLPLVVRAGVDTAEWAWDRPDVKDRVRHRRPVVQRSWREPGASWEAHTYRATIPLPGRYLVDGVRVERTAGPGGPLTLVRLGVFDSATNRFASVAPAGAWLADVGHFREVAATPDVRLFELTQSAPWARVAERLVSEPDDGDVLARLAAPAKSGLDVRKQALLSAEDGATPAEIAGGVAGRAEVVRAVPGRLDLMAEGPGWLVVAEGWDRGWEAKVDDAPREVRRVNEASLAVALPPGRHRIAFRYAIPGLGWGLLTAGATALALAALVLRGRRELTL